MSLINTVSVESFKKDRVFKRDFSSNSFPIFQRGLVFLFLLFFVFIGLHGCKTNPVDNDEESSGGTVLLIEIDSIRCLDLDSVRRVTGYIESDNPVNGFNCYVIEQEIGDTADSADIHLEHSDISGKKEIDIKQDADMRIRVSESADTGDYFLIMEVITDDTTFIDSVSFCVSDLDTVVQDSVSIIVESIDSISAGDTVVISGCVCTSPGVEDFSIGILDSNFYEVSSDIWDVTYSSFIGRDSVGLSDTADMKLCISDSADNGRYYIDLMVKAGTVAARKRSDFFVTGGKSYVQGNITEDTISSM